MYQNLYQITGDNTHDKAISDNIYMTNYVI